MNNYKLVIQYDGARYKGWQRLGQGENTIQGKIENVISEMVGKPIEIIGSSRTDAGVHAYEQIANVKLSEHFTPVEVKNYLNKYLPNDISVVHVEQADDRFHARYNAKEKTYLYKIWNESHSHPFMRKYSMHVEETLNIEKMKHAAQYFIGSHDFTAYSNAKSKKKSMVRDIYSIDIEEKNGFINIRIRGNGFLYNMVRKMVGSLIEVGLNEMSPEQIAETISTKQRKDTGRLADPAGLYLEKIQF